jgi:hypothetical protein
MKKGVGSGVGSGSISQRYGSGVPDWQNLIHSNSLVFLLSGSNPPPPPTTK